jgi:sulfite reductase (NADPH) flavoprotein alpha-component
MQFTVVGFGSLAYPDFCKYAIDIDQMLRSNTNLKPILEVHKINNQSFEAFKDWCLSWSTATNTSIQLKEFPKKNKSTKDLSFSVEYRSSLNSDDTFLIRLQPEHKTVFESGDLLCFYPKNDPVARLYSIGKIDDDILLSIKKHEFGVCSTYFSTLIKNDIIKASIQRNPDFHFPTKAKEVIMIANGTGIAPFLGMLHNTKRKTQTYLFWGGRNEKSLELYNEIIEYCITNDQLTAFYPAYSRVEKEQMYVQHLLQKNTSLIAKTLHHKGVVLICGSIIMQKETIAILDKICQEINNKPLSYYQNNGQLKMDCY